MRLRSGKKKGDEQALVVTQISKKRTTQEELESEPNSDGPPVKKQRRKSAKSMKQVRTVKNKVESDKEPDVGCKANGKTQESKTTAKPQSGTEVNQNANVGDPPRIQSSKAGRSTKEGMKLNKNEIEATKEDTGSPAPAKVSTKAVDEGNQSSGEESPSDPDEVNASDEDETPEVAVKAREKVQSTLKSGGNDPYPDWKAGEPVPYAALCTTFSKIEMTTKRLEILAHCSLFLRQVLRLTPRDLLPTVLLMINKLAADYSGIELGIGESLIMKAIGESTGRSISIIKADQNEIGDLGLVAAKSRSNQPTMFKPKALTVRGVYEGLMAIAVTEGQGAQARKIAGIKKLLSAADAHMAGKGGKGADITKDKGGPSEAKFIVRTLEGKLRLGLADKTVLVALAQAVIFHEVAQESNKIPSTEQLANGEAILKSVYRFMHPVVPRRVSNC